MGVVTMTNELREDIKAAVRSHDADASDLRAIASDLEELADKWDAIDDAL